MCMLIQEQGFLDSSCNSPKNDFSRVKKKAYGLDFAKKWLLLVIKGS